MSSCQLDVLHQHKHNYQKAGVVMRYEIEKPKCEKCGAEMWLARIEPNEPGHDLRTFECPAATTR